MVDAARSLLAEGGIEAITVNALAERSGVNKTTVYRNWPEPRRLVHDVLGEIGDVPDLADTGYVRDDLVAMFRGLAVMFAARFTRARRDHARAVVARGVERGELQPDVDSRALIEGIVGPIYYRVLMTREPVRRADVEALVDRALALARP